MAGRGCAWFLVAAAASAGCATRLVDGDRRDAGTVALVDAAPSPDLAAPIDLSLVDEAAPPDLVATCQSRWRRVLAPTTNALFGVWGDAPAPDRWIVGTGGTILRSRDGGQTFTVEASGTTVDLYGVTGTGPGDVWVVGDVGTILHSRGDGAWSPRPIPPPSNVALIGPYSPRPGELFVAGSPDPVGMTETILHTSDGTTFVRQTVSYAQLSWLYSIWGDGKQLFAVGDNLTILRYDPPGEAWYPEGTDNLFLRNLIGVWGDGRGEVWASGELGALEHLDPATGQWTFTQLPAGGYLDLPWGLPGGPVFLVGDHGTILRSDDHKTWQAEPTCVGIDLEGIGGSSLADVIAVGQGGLVLRRN